MKLKLSKHLAVLATAIIVSSTASACGSSISGTDKPDLNDSGTGTWQTVDSSPMQTDNNTVTEAPVNPQPQDSTPSVPQAGKLKAHLVCAGDNLIHDNIYVDAQNDDGTYDFAKCYEPCKKLMEGVDIGILNQETLVNDLYGPKTYPTFSTPTEVGDCMIDFGFNVFSMSNNHVLDMGIDGLMNSLDYWDSKGVVHYGAYRDKEDSENIKTAEFNGIKFAFLGYMEHTNGIEVPPQNEGVVVYIHDEDTLKRQIQEADKMADVVVVSCHMGTEIENELNDMQINLPPKLVEWGADLIIGTQAHALSTCEYLDKPDGGQAFVFYGLGNFFSTMYDCDNPDGRIAKSLVGIFGMMDVIKDCDNGGKISFENVKAIPVVSHFEAESYDSMWYNCRVYPYSDYTDELLSKHLMHQRDGMSRRDLEQNIAFIPDEFLCMDP